MKQVSVLLAGPAHGSPVPMAGGLVYDLERILVPFPQVWVQGSSHQSLQPPFPGMIQFLNGPKDVEKGNPLSQTVWHTVSLPSPQDERMALPLGAREGQTVSGPTSRPL